MVTDNPQATPSEAEIAWLAGIIEGEGSIALSAWSRGAGNPSDRKVGFNLKIYNTDALIIKKCVSILDRLNIGLHLKEREQKPMLRPDGNGHYSSPDPMLTITVSQFDAALALVRTIKPWLFGQKAARADLLQRYLTRRAEKFAAANGYKRLKLDDGDWALVREFSTLSRVKHQPALVGVLNE